MERWEAKLIALFGMFIIIFLCMILPIKVSRMISGTGDKSSRILGILRCFAGGVFLGTILLHMIPETHDQIQEYLLEPKGWTYPFAELCVVGGFFFICIFERAVLAVDAKKRKKKRNMTYLASNEVMTTTHANQPEGTPCPLNEVMDDAEGYSNYGFNQHSLDRKQIPNANESAEKKDGAKVEANGDSPQSKEEIQEQEEATKTRSIILVLALSFECIFDGLSVSLQLEERGVWNMFLAIISHEFIIAFCLGIELVKYYTTTKVILSAFAYAMMPPVGCVIGLIITEAHLDVDLHTVEMASGLLIAVAAGIFLYCTFIGMLGEELIQDCTWEKILATLIGCGIMCGMAAIPDPAASLEETLGNTTVFPMTT
eukprot:GHVO01036867.1.p1 GENE.GHVO01036867.1~~GHVO01036867.1.p1  ORF type:complete len:371 (+),score=58.41 GHVO01036867.1:36-1148(+)